VNSEFWSVTAESKAKLTSILVAIRDQPRFPFGALWVFDFDGQSKGWNVSATNERSWQLDAIQQANARIGSKR
jgi:hypothetical protein